MNTHDEIRIGGRFILGCAALDVIVILSVWVLA
jgi:hypothetical protein